MTDVKRRARPWLSLIPSRRGVEAGRRSSVLRFRDVFAAGRSASARRTAGPRPSPRPPFHCAAIPAFGGGPARASCKITKQSLESRAERLLDGGYVERKARYRDRRMRQLRLTAEGAALETRTLGGAASAARARLPRGRARRRARLPPGAGRACRSPSATRRERSETHERRCRQTRICSSSTTTSACARCCSDI